MDLKVGRGCPQPAAARRGADSAPQSPSRAENRRAEDTAPYPGNSVREVIRSWLLLFASLAFSFVAIDYLVAGGTYLRHFGQSWSSHFAPANSFEYGSANEHPFDWSILLKNWDATIPALVGIVVLLREGLSRNRKLGIERRNPDPLGKRWFNEGSPTDFRILAVAWLALMLAIFTTHKPWWSYYYVHIAIPLCWCAAIGWDALWRHIFRHRNVVSRLFLGILAVCAAGWMGTRVYFQVAGIRNSPQTHSALVLGQIERLKPFTKFMYSDDSIYSFHARIPMPPELAVVPLKRLWAGDMTNARVAEEMWATKPEVILLRNDTREVPFQELLDAEYRVVYQDAQHRLYTQKSLAKQAGY